MEGDGMLPPGTAARSPTAVVSPTPGRPATRPRSPLAPAAVLTFPPVDGRRLLTVSRQPGLPGGRFGGVASGQQDDKPADPPRSPGEAGDLRARGSETPPGPPGARSSLPQDRVPAAWAVIVTLPAQLDAAAEVHG